MENRTMDYIVSTAVAAKHVRGFKDLANAEPVTDTGIMEASNMKRKSEAGSNFQFLFSSFQFPLSIFLFPISIFQFPFPP